MKQCEHFRLKCPSYYYPDWTLYNLRKLYILINDF